MMHPSETMLSLFAGGDLRMVDRWRVSRHIHRCPACHTSVRQFHTASEVLTTGLNELPPELNWNRLAREMTGNIRVGLAAGECVGEPVIKPAYQGWRSAAVVCSAALLMLVAWLINIPRKPMQEAGIALQKTELGIQLKQGSGAMTLLHTRASSPVISSSSPGQLRARYVDDETNQVTINNVYAQ